MSTVDGTSFGLLNLLRRIPAALFETSASETPPVRISFNRVRTTSIIRGLAG